MAVRKKIKKVGKKFVDSDHIVFTFLRSAISSQAASWVDMGSSIALVAMHVSSWIATPIGAVLGGIVNCCINYKYTFHAKNVSRKAVAVKYAMVWFGSLTLNTVGTSLLTIMLDHSSLLVSMGFTNVGNYAVARLVVSLLVSWFWNFLLQRNFVYRSTSFDPHAIAFVDRFMPSLGKKREKEKSNQNI